MRQVADLSGGRLELTPLNQGELLQLGDPDVTQVVDEFLAAGQHDVWVLGGLGVALGRQMADLGVRFTVDSAVLTHTTNEGTSHIKIGPEPWDEVAAARDYLVSLGPLNNYERPFKPGAAPVERLEQQRARMLGAVATLRPDAAPGQPDESSLGVRVLFVPRAWDGLAPPRISRKQFSTANYPAVVAARYVADSLLTIVHQPPTTKPEAA